MMSKEISNQLWITFSLKNTPSGIDDRAVLLAQVEAAFDREYEELAIPHPNRHLAAWYLLTVCEDYERNMFAGLFGEIHLANLEYETDRLKYSLKFCLKRIFKEASDQSTCAVPQRITPLLYKRAGKLLIGGKEYAVAHQLCCAARVGTVTFVEREPCVIETIIDELEHDKQYAALELIGHREIGIVDPSALFYAWLNRPELQPPCLQVIAESVRLKGRLIEYEYDQYLAELLAQSMQQQPFLIPEAWQFPWGGRFETTLLINALCVRCLYHLVAIHFGASRLTLVGGGEANICLVLSSDRLEHELELMSSLKPQVIRAFINYLTYGQGAITPDPALQPLIPLGSNMLGIPCIHFLSSNHERNLLSLQARVQKKQFDTLSKLFEQQMVSRIAASLTPKWLHLHHNIRPLGHSGEEIDMLIADPASQTLLVCEMKWMLQPGDPGEVKNRKADCRKKIDQLARKIVWASVNIESILSRTFNARVPYDPQQPWAVQGVVVIETYGGTRSHNPLLPIMTAEVFERGMLGSSTLAAFAAWSQQLKWLPQEDVHFCITEHIRNLGGRTLKSSGMNRLQTPNEYRQFVKKTLADDTALEMRCAAFAR